MTTKSGKKRPRFQRVWRDNDEISLLQGIVDFKAVTDKSPKENPNGFYEFVKDSISFAASKRQVVEKIRSLKKKLVKNGGEEPKFHDQKVYKLSKHLWGLEGIISQSNDLSRKLRGKKKLETNLMDNHQFDWFEKSFLVKSICGFGVDEHHVKKYWGLVSVQDKKQIEAKLKFLQDKELDYIFEKSGFHFN